MQAGNKNALACGINPLKLNKTMSYGKKLKNLAGYDFLRLALGFLIMASLSGCTLFSINIGPQVKSLKEKVVSGEGRNKVLLVEIQGFISNEKKKSLIGSQFETGMVEKVREVLQKAEKDDDIKALLIRINSPGGTVTSSDMIYHELKEFKKKKKIKIYAAMMDLAASGGYYIAMAADTIFAHPTTLTGSIGVISIKINAKELSDKIGLDWEIVKSGDKKDFLSPFRGLTPEERKLFQETIDSFHEQFVKVVDENRPELDLATVKKLADGRVYTAQQALEAKLVDKIGYLDDVEEFIKKDLKVEEFKLIIYHRSGQYKSNVYSSVPGPSTVNLFNFDLSTLPKALSPQFMYLWMQ